MVHRKKYVPDLKRMGAHFESNFRRMQRVLNLLGSREHTAISLQDGEHFLGRVTVKLLEESRYTDTFLLEQTAAAGKWLNNPSMTVRVYHDASMAEVINCAGYSRFQGSNRYPNQFMHHPDEKSQLNAFLAEWLDFVLKYGCSDLLPFPNSKM